MVCSSYLQTAAPTIKPVDLKEAMHHAQADDDEDADLIDSLIDAATGYAQEFQWSQLCPATWEFRQTRFTNPIELHPNPVISVSSVKYVDTGGTLQTLTVDDDYTVDVIRKPGLVYPAYNQTWPATRGFADDVLITFVAGYSEVPAVTRQAILMIVKYWYDNPGCSGDEIPSSAKALLGLNSFRTFY